MMNKKILSSAITAGAAAVVIVVALLWIVAQSQPSHTPQIQPTVSHNIKLGLVIMPPTQTPTLAEIKSTSKEPSSTAMRRSNAYLSWPLIEPQVGTYN